MSKTLTAVAAALALLISYPTMAASKTSEAKPATAETCKTLEKQVEDAAKTHASSPKFKEADMARSEGSKLCTDGKYAEGTAKLHHALKELGMKVSKTSY